MVFRPISTLFDRFWMVLRGLIKFWTFLGLCSFLRRFWSFLIFFDILVFFRLLVVFEILIHDRFCILRFCYFGRFWSFAFSPILGLGTFPTKNLWTFSTKNLSRSRARDEQQGPQNRGSVFEIFGRSVLRFWPFFEFLIVLGFFVDVTKKSKTPNWAERAQFVQIANKMRACSLGRNNVSSVRLPG